MAKPDPEQYESFAEAFEEHASASPYNALYDRPSTLDLLGGVHGLRVLDAACGPGLYQPELLQRGARVTGFDASPRMIELARKRSGSTVELRVHDLDAPLDWLPNASIDLTLCALAYHYASDRPAFLAEQHRVLRPAGALVISTHHPTADWVRLGGAYFQVTPVTETWSKGWEVTAWRMPLGQMTEEFSAAGFCIERLVEPLPDPAMATSHPKQYAKLSTQPNFMGFRLIKKPS